MKRRRTGDVLLCIDWVDASYQHGELAAGDVDPLIAVRTVGWLVRADERSLSVAQEYFPSEQRYRHVSSIPRVNIKKVTRLRA